jgi:hypothetical protein
VDLDQNNRTTQSGHSQPSYVEALENDQIHRRSAVDLEP